MAAVRAAVIADAHGHAAVPGAFASFVDGGRTVGGTALPLVGGLGHAGRSGGGLVGGRDGSEAGEELIEGEPVAIYDLMGKDATLFHYAISDDDTSHGTQFVEAARQWFDSLWDAVAREYQE